MYGNIAPIAESITVLGLAAVGAVATAWLLIQTVIFVWGAIRYSLSSGADRASAEAEAQDRSDNERHGY